MQFPAQSNEEEQKSTAYQREVIHMKRLRKRLRRMADASGIPQELYDRTGRVTMIGFGRVAVENHTGLGALSGTAVHVRLQKESVTVQGQNLVVVHLGETHVVIEGEIHALVKGEA